MKAAIGLSSRIRYHASFYSDEAQQNIECTKRMRINIGVERVRSWDILRDKGADNTRYLESYRYTYRQHTHVGRRTGHYVDSELFLKKRIWRWTSRLAGVIDASLEICAIKSVKNASKCRGLPGQNAAAFPVQVLGVQVACCVECYGLGVCRRRCVMRPGIYAT